MTKYCRLRADFTGRFSLFRCGFITKTPMPAALFIMPIISNLPNGRELNICGRSDWSQQDALENEDKFGFAVRHIDVDYKAPAVLDDALTVTCEVKEFGGASAVMFQQIWRGEKLLTELEVKVVYLSLNKKRPVRIPQELAAAIEKL